MISEMKLFWIPFVQTSCTKNTYILKQFLNIVSTELLGLFWTLSIVLYVEDKKSHNVSETGSVSVLRWRGQDEPTGIEVPVESGNKFLYACVREVCCQ
jgi:hypothetical protein